MKSTRSFFSYVTCFLMVSMVWGGAANAAVTWTGAVDGDIENDANYDFSGSGLTTIAGIQGSTVADDIIYNGNGAAPVLTNVDATQTNFGASAFSLTFDGVVSPSGGGNEGWSGGTVTLANGAQTTSFFYLNSTVSIDATSSMILEGGGNPVNVTTVDLALGAVVTFTAETVEQFNNEHLTKFTVNGAALVDGVNGTIVSDGANGSIVTAVPEPGSLALLALASLGLALYRRRS